MTRTLLRTFRALDPARDDPAAPDEALLREILGAPAPTAAPRRRTRRRLALAAVAAVSGACAVVAGVALTPSSVDVVAAAHKAVSGRNTILHYRTEWTVGHRDTPAGTYEVWEEADGPGARQIIRPSRPSPATRGGADGSGRRAEPGHEGRVEIVRTAHSDRFYWPDRNELRIFLGDVRESKPAFAPTGLEQAGDLSTLFSRARTGRAQVAELRETDVRGIAVHEIRIGPEPRPCAEIDGRARREDEPWAPVYVYVDTERFEPVRAIVSSCLADGALTGGVTIDYTLFERLPRTPKNERLLRMSPHPGAKRFIERIDAG